MAIQHSPAPGTEPLNTEPLSAIIEDAYTYERFGSAVEIRLSSSSPWHLAAWFEGGAVPRPGPTCNVVEATETGEMVCPDWGALPAWP